MVATRHYITFRTLRSIADTIVCIRAFVWRLKVCVFVNAMKYAFKKNTELVCCCSYLSSQIKACAHLLYHTFEKKSFKYNRTIDDFNLIGSHWGCGVFHVTLARSVHRTSLFCHFGTSDSEGQECFLFKIIHIKYELMITARMKIHFQPTNKVFFCSFWSI